MSRDRFWVTRIHDRDGYQVIDLVERGTALTFSVYKARSKYVWRNGLGLDIGTRLEVGSAVDSYQVREAVGISHAPPRGYAERVGVVPPKRGFFARIFGR